MSRTVLRVLTYHRVMDPAGADTCDPATISATPGGFERQVRELAQRCQIVCAEEVLSSRRSGRPLPRRAVLITFDDAYRDFGDVAWPILRQYGCPATLFVPTGYPDHPELGFWWDRLYRAIATTDLREVDDPALGLLRFDSREARHTSARAAQRRLKTMPHGQAMDVVDGLCRRLGERQRPGGDVLTWDELQRLAAEGVTLGAHTRTHAALTRLPRGAARREIEASRDDLARELGEAPRVFAYPFGDHDDDVVSLVREAGFELAMTCLDGHNAASTDPLRLCRTNVTRRTTPLVLRARLTAFGARVDRWRHRPGRAAHAHAGGTRASASDPRPLKVGYIMSRFPKLSETFVLNEMVTLDSLGVPVEIYPLLRERQPTAHPEVSEWTRRAHFPGLLSPGIVWAHAHFLARRPVGYLTAGVEVLRRTWGSPNLFIGGLGTFPKAVRFAYEMHRDGIAHVHAHFATHPALAALVIHRLTGLPFSFTAHGSDLHVDRRMLDVKLEAAAFAVTVSQFNKEVMVRECGEHTRHRIHVVHCGVDTARFTPARDRPHDGVLRLVCVASLEPVKGHTYLIEACRLLQERGIAFRCDLVGDGPLRRTLARQITRRGLDGSLRLLGGRPRPEVITLLEAADVAVLASHPTREGKREGIPVALMEAMACGLPVVSSAISGIPELVETEVTGILVPSADPTAIAAALERLAGNSALRTRMGQAGRRKVLREFDLETNTRQLLMLFSASAVPRPVKVPSGVPASTAVSG